MGDVPRELWFKAANYFLRVTVVFSIQRDVSFPQDLLTKHKQLVSEFLERNYDKVFFYYQKLLNSENYVTRRQALKVRVCACVCAWTGASRVSGRRQVAVTHGRLVHMQRT